MASLLAILAGVCWGSIGIFIRTLDAAGFDNITMVFSRTIVCTILMLLYILVTDRQKLRIRPSGLLYMLIMSVFGTILLMTAYNIAVISLSLSLAAILLCLAPVFVLLISAVLFREKITGKKVICMVMALAGCVLLSGIFEDSGLSWSIRGILMGLAAAVCNAIFIIMSKVVAKEGYSSFTVSFYNSLFSSIMLVAFADLHVLGDFVISAPASSGLFLIMQTLISSIIPLVAYVTAMKYIDAGKTAILQSGAEPTAALLVGAVVYSEMPSVIGLAGLVITVIALSVLAGDK